MILITDLLGKTKYTRTINNTNNTQRVGTAIKLDDTQFAKGLYIVTVSNGSETFVSKLIVE
jgi:hypothetical protein